MPKIYKRATIGNKLITELSLNQQLRSQTIIARAERAKGEALLASIGEGLIATNEEGKIVQINKVALDLLKFSKKELLGSWFPAKIVASYEDGSPVELLERPGSRVFQTGKTVSDTLFYKRKNGEMFPVHITASPVFLRNKPIGAIEIFRDISKEIEIDRQKSEFISLASHQLRTPLSSINLYSHMLKDGYAGKLTKKQLDLLKVVTNSTEKMNDLISTLLNISRVEGDSIAIESRPVDLNKLINEIFNNFNQRFINKNIKFSKKIYEEVPLINTDKLIVGEILSNLVSNSLKYTPTGSSVMISLLMKGANVLFTISDKGYGIPYESQQFIFSKFFRAENITKHDVTGTGLGLYITKVLSDKIGANIWFKSKEGKGTTFYLAIPLKGNKAEEGSFKLEYIE